ncbi:hypothetical protein [Ferrimonas aestuarii]|uniref:Uncharacterized protein n=1 Tax=Ferrimonas aestuarii TaxID=2569539 RepID=A0A4U1BK17_9GAMM|nr:hypothetical protein [Ferrimonas aestuarii]TKB51946.1 hypothetical protein FCL42_16130 [Ferrimonas aestuarii]
MRLFIKKNFPRIDPSPLVIWTIASLFLLLFCSVTGISTDFIEGNATVINLFYGIAVTAIILPILILLLLWFEHDNCFYKYSHWVARLFSDTALGSAGFITVQFVFIDKNVEKGLWVFFGSLLFAIVTNHLFLAVFDQNRGSRKLVKSIDRSSNTEISSRKVEVKVMVFSLIVAVLTAGGVLWSLWQLKV